MTTERDCQHCGRKFAPKRDWQIYCGKYCNYRAFWERHHPEKRGPGRPMRPRIRKEAAELNEPGLV